MSVRDITQVPRIGRREAPGLAEEEYRRLATVASELAPDDWARPTDCAGWTVRDILAHMAGAMAGTALKEGSRQRKVASQRAVASGGLFLDEMNALQIEDRAGLSDADIARELREQVEPATRNRRRVPALMRRAPIPNSGGLRLADVVDVLLTRSTWMHRVDVCRGTGRDIELTPDHDGRIIADVVRDWADRHGEPFTLRLTGLAGGTFTRGGNGPELELDAVEFCRTLSGRATGEGLLATPIVF